MYPVVGESVNDVGMVYVEPDASTKYPWGVDPVIVSVVGQTEPSTRSMIRAYSRFMPWTVGVAVNDTALVAVE